MNWSTLTWAMPITTVTKHRSRLRTVHLLASLTLKCAKETEVWLLNARFVLRMSNPKSNCILKTIPMAALTVLSIMVMSIYALLSPMLMTSAMPIWQTLRLIGLDSDFRFCLPKGW